MKHLRYYFGKTLAYLCIFFAQISIGFGHAALWFTDEDQT